MSYYIDDMLFAASSGSGYGHGGGGHGGYGCSCGKSSSSMGTGDQLGLLIAAAAAFFVLLMAITGGRRKKRYAERTFESLKSGFMEDLIMKGRNDGFFKMNDIFYSSKFQNSMNSFWKSNFTKKYK